MRYKEPDNRLSRQKDQGNESDPGVEPPYGCICIHRSRLLADNWTVLPRPAVSRPQSSLAKPSDLWSIY